MQVVNYRMADINICVRSALDIGIYDHAIPYITQDTNVDFMFDFVKIDDLEEYTIGAELLYYTSFFMVLKNREIELRAFHQQGNIYAVSYLEDKQGYCFYIDERLQQKINNGIMEFMFMNIEQIFLKFNTFVLHSSQIQVFQKGRKQGLAFTAPSGTGKSTQADLWKCEQGALVVNGDRSAIRKTDCGWKIYGIPMSGSSEIFYNEISDLKAVVVLRQAFENRIEKIEGRQAFQFLYSECSINYWNENYVNKMFQLLTELIEEIPIYLFCCTKEKDAVHYLYSELYGNEDEGQK